jgi:hypothetical protein
MKVANDCFGLRYRHLLIDELQGKLNLPRGPSCFADHSKPRAFDRVRRQAHVHHVEHIEELPAELKVGTLQTTASMGNRRCLDDSKVEVVISRPARVFSFPNFVENVPERISQFGEIYDAFVRMRSLGIHTGPSSSSPAPDS